MVAVAGTAEAAVPGPRRRPRRSSGSGCEVEAAVAEAGGRKEEGGRGRSLLALLLTGCPAGVEGARHKAGLESGGGGGLLMGWSAASKNGVREMWTVGGYMGGAESE